MVFDWWALSYWLIVLCSVVLMSCIVLAQFDVWYWLTWLFVLAQCADLYFPSVLSYIDSICLYCIGSAQCAVFYWLHVLYCVGYVCCFVFAQYAALYGLSALQCSLLYYMGTFSVLSNHQHIS